MKKDREHRYLPTDEDLVDYLSRTRTVQQNISQKTEHGRLQTPQKQMEGILPWISPRWQRIGFFASLGLIPFIILSPCEPKACSIIFTTLLIASFLYAGLKTSWLKDVHKAPASAKAAGAFNIVLGFFLIAVLLTSVALLIGFFYLLGLILSAVAKKR